MCSLRTDDLDPGRRLVQVRAEATKSRRERVVPYSATTGVLLSQYLVHRAMVSRSHGGLFPVGIAAQLRPAAEPVDVVEGGAPDRSDGRGGSASPRTPRGACA
ncbi:hypothetical protein ACIREM_16805 [Streptomyces shenzhenensis]|uniref:hypothetical protein n=1 Tax=Streptomyces shenzhenensis TaxID=943815 RepID=UPI003819A216